MRILCYIFLLLTFEMYAQEVSFQFSFEDEMTNSPIDSVHLGIYTTSNQTVFKNWIQNKSLIEIKVPYNQMVRIKAERPGYHILDTLLNLSLHDRNIKKGKAVAIPLVLSYDGQSSVEFDVTATYKPAVAFSSEIISVSDYVVIDDKSMILLAYPKRLSASSELIYFKDDSIISRRKVPGIALRLDTDYRNRIYLRCEYKDYMLTDSKALSMVIVPRDQLNNYVQPILDTLENEQLFFTTYKSHYPAFDFFNVNLSDTTHELLHHIEDTEMMEHYRAEYKWADVRTKLWAWDMEAETGIDREIWVGANVFTNSIYYQAPYSEFFLIEDMAYVFDFYKDLLFIYDAYSGEKLDSLPINFHKDVGKRKWEARMFQDPITKKVYTSYDAAGYVDVFEISTITGELKEKFTLYYRYVENIQIYNEEVYYVYRPFESIQKKYLYKEGFSDKKRSLAGQERFNYIAR